MGQSLDEGGIASWVWKEDMVLGIFMNGGSSGMLIGVYFR